MLLPRIRLRGSHKEWGDHSCPRHLKYWMCKVPLTELDRFLHIQLPVSAIYCECNWQAFRQPLTKLLVTFTPSSTTLSTITRNVVQYREYGIQFWKRNVVLLCSTTTLSETDFGCFHRCPRSRTTFQPVYLEKSSFPSRSPIGPEYGSSNQYFVSPMANGQLRLPKGRASHSEERRTEGLMRRKLHLNSIAGSDLWPIERKHWPLGELWDAAFLRCDVHLPQAPLSLRSRSTITVS